MKGILIDHETGDLLIEKRQMQIGNAEQQVVGLLLETSPGEWKEYPMLGADARSQLGGNIDPFWPLQTKKMIRACGVDVKNVVVSGNDEIEIS